MTFDHPVLREETLYFSAQLSDTVALLNVERETREKKNEKR